MKNKILSFLPNDKHDISVVDFSHLHIADWKKVDSSRLIELTEEAPEINCVCLVNASRLPVVFDGFKDNALPIDIAQGLHNRQCECVLFPHEEADHWVLFVEMKYARDEECCFAREHDYPNNMVEQILETVSYFRNKTILSPTQRVHALVSFPNMLDGYEDRLFSTLQEENDLSVEDIKLNHNVVIRGGNGGKIISKKRIKLRTS